jgi:hypothetical protein
VKRIVPNIKAHGGFSQYTLAHSGDLAIKIRPCYLICGKLGVNSVRNQEMGGYIHPDRFQNSRVLGRKSLRNNMLRIMFRQNFAQIGGILLIQKQRNDSSVSYC